MEKMNQVSVSEFFAKSKEEMYDMAVEMVDKYNRLVDICNDSAERMAEFMAKDDINEFKKELQSKVPGEFKIQKLADIVVWADGKIRDGGYNEEKYKSDGATAYCNVKAHELWRIRDVALKSMERHSVYTSALNKDIADKAAKIDLLEKEIEGRKEGYVALKELMDTKYISIEEHNNICEDFKKKIVKLEKESEKWQDLAKMNRDTICNQYDVCGEFKNKIAELEEMTRYWESQYEYVLKCRKEDIEDLEGRLKEEIDLVCSAEERLIELQKENEELENTVKRLNKELADCKVKIRHQKENLDGINKTLEIRTKENESLIKVRNNLNKEIEAHESENARLSEKIMKLHNTITELSHDIDNYKSWNASLHKDIKELKKNKEDDYGKSGFKRYIEHLIEEEERAVPERFKERLNEEITAIFTKEEETKVNDIPCGEDAIE